MSDLYVCVCGSAFDNQDKLDNHIYQEHILLEHIKPKLSNNQVRDYLVKRIGLSYFDELKVTTHHKTSHKVTVKSDIITVEVVKGYLTEDDYVNKLEEMKLALSIRLHLVNMVLHDLGANASKLITSAGYRYTEEGRGLYYFSRGEGVRDSYFDPAQEELEEYISRLKMDLLREVEGTPVLIAKTSPYHLIDYSIDNVSISSLLESGQKLRIEVLE